MGRMYPPLTDVLMGRLVVFRSKAGNAAVAVVEEGSSNPAVGDVDVRGSSELYGGGGRSSRLGDKTGMIAFYI